MYLKYDTAEVFCVIKNIDTDTIKHRCLFGI